MKVVLGRKQSIENADWIKAMKDIEQLVSREELQTLVDATVEEIKLKTAGKKAAYAWSAGKDSLVLGDICRQAGIEECMIGVCNLEYPVFMQWIEDNKPVGCQVINTGQDLEWLAKHPDMVFPKESTKAARWFAIVQHRAQAKYYKDLQLDMILLGRRRADGNFVGRGDNIYTSKGVTRYSPLAAWEHEYLLAYIHYNKIALPPIYGWQNGYKCGTHPWPARQWTENGWKEVLDIDPDIVREAAAVIPAAKEFLSLESGVTA
ncbi:MAG: phosphoadenosine phosphosulfate reductase family protein [Lachnospiraceae bacterium]